MRTLLVCVAAVLVACSAETTGSSGAKSSGDDIASIYCGGDYIQGDPSTLYRCTGGAQSVEQVCANGCEVESDGTNDECY